MPKRKMSDTLTGGTGDVNPQWLRVQVTEGTPGVAQSIQVPVPVQRLQQSSGRAQVMEILKIAWDATQYISTTAGTCGTSGFLATSGNLPVPTSGLAYENLKANSKVISYAQNYWINVGGASAALFGTGEDGNNFFQDLTDGAGHGILIATDFLYLSVLSGTAAGRSVNPAASQTVTVYILYRWKEVSLAEYIGIVQSQQ